MYGGNFQSMYSALATISLSINEQSATSAERIHNLPPSIFHPTRRLNQKEKHHG
jgi:hypothetical protein